MRSFSRFRWSGPVTSHCLAALVKLLRWRVRAGSGSYATDRRRGCCAVLRTARAYPRCGCQDRPGGFPDKRDLRLKGATDPITVPTAEFAELRTPRSALGSSESNSARTSSELRVSCSAISRAWATSASIACVRDGPDGRVARSRSYAAAAGAARCSRPSASWRSSVARAVSPWASATSASSNVSSTRRSAVDNAGASSRRVSSQPARNQATRSRQQERRRMSHCLAHNPGVRLYTNELRKVCQRRRPIRNL
jgi:hypothetical protein